MSLKEAMAAAKDAAAQAPAVIDDNTGSELTTTDYGTSLDSFLSGSMQVDSWIQVKDAGFRLDRDDKAFISEFEAELDVNSIQLFTGLRAEFAGNNVEYRQSFDGGKTTTQGENFAEVLRKWKASAVKGGDRPYRGANMTLILTEDTTQGKTTLPAGHKVGYTTSVTGWYPFQNLLKQLAADGKVTDVGGGRLAGDPIRVKITHEAKANDKGQDYGVLHMEVLD
jgi:hypothetical protein